MTNESLKLFDKGTFEEIDEGFLNDMEKAAKILKECQINHNKPDIDTLFNEWHDSKVASYMKFALINIEKHGFDCKLSDEESIYLESKVSGISTMAATFNDTTYEKAEAFKDEKTWLALSVWENISDLAFICYGQNEKIGDFLKKGVDKHKDGKVKRSTQTISLHALLFDYDFKILAINMSKDKIYETLTSRRGFKELSKDKIIELKDFKKISE